MPGGTFIKADVQCPFYRSDKGKTISCEGLVENSTITLGYENRGDKNIQVSAFCCRHYQKCEVYRMLMEKYEEE